MPLYRVECRQILFESTDYQKMHSILGHDTQLMQSVCDVQHTLTSEGYNNWMIGFCRQRLGLVHKEGKRGQLSDFS